MALEGARAIHNSMKLGEASDVVGERKIMNRDHPGIPRVTIHPDAVPYVGAGRNVMHGFILKADPWIIVGQPCLVVDSDDNLIAHGISNATSDEMELMLKGVAVKVRDGALPKDGANNAAIDS